MTKGELEFPVGCFIKWNGDYYKVRENSNDRRGWVEDLLGDVYEFLFTCDGEKSVKITDKTLIKQLQDTLSLV